MAHLNIYLSKERETWLRKRLDDLAQQENRSLSYIVEEALVKFIELSGQSVPQQRRRGHRRHAAR